MPIQMPIQMHIQKCCFRGQLAVGISFIVAVPLLLAACGATSTASVTSTAIGTTAPTAPAVTATTVATQSPSQTWTTIQSFTASGNYTSASFQVTSPWRLVWQCNVTMGIPEFPLLVAVLPSSGTATGDGVMNTAGSFLGGSFFNHNVVSGGAYGVIDTVCEIGNVSGTTAPQTAPSGLVYLSVASTPGGEWNIRVQVLR